MATKQNVRSQADGRSQPRRHPADLVETGNLLRTQSDAFPAESRTQDDGQPSRHEVIVVGAGQAGLSVGYHLKRKGLDFVILDGAARIGDVWRKRWDSLRLFTPAKLDSLDGFRFPAPGDSFPTKDAMADYLEAYAERFALPVRLKTRVDRLCSSGGRFRAETSGGVYEADQIVIAASGYQKPRLPAFAKDIAADVPQLHSYAYRNPGQLPGHGPVLVVGAGNSGAEIAMDLARTHKVYLSGRNVGHIPFDIAGFMGRKLLDRFVIRGLFHRILTMRTPMGRRFRARMHNHGMPLIRQRPGQLERAGVERVGRIAAIEDGRAVTEDGAEVPFASVVWSTGLHSGFDWIDLPFLDEDGEPNQRFGRSREVDGLYFAGLPFQYAMSSTLVAGVGRDARRVAGWIASSRRRSAAH